MVARVLGAAPVLADAIIDQLAAPSDKATNAGRQLTQYLEHSARCRDVILESAMHRITLLASAWLHLRGQHQLHLVCKAEWETNTSASFHMTNVWRRVC